jgi:ABC-2 type transport system permease protein
MTRALGMAYRMEGPAALTGDWRRFGFLATRLAVIEFKLRFFGSVLGYLWTLMRPLLLFGVLYGVFSQILRLGTGVRFYPIMLLMNIVLYTYFGESTAGAVACVVDRENLVRKIHFPRMVIPLSVTLTAAMNLLTNLVAVIVFVAAAGVPVRLTWLEFPLLLVALFVLTTGLAMLLSSLYVPFRDVRPIWDVILQALFYATPIIFPLEQIAHRSQFAAHVAMCNPFATILVQARHAVLDPHAPSAASAIGGAVYLLIPAAILIGIFLVGLFTFDRLAPRIAEEL